VCIKRSVQICGLHKNIPSQIKNSSRDIITIFNIFYNHIKKNRYNILLNILKTKRYHLHIIIYLLESSLEFISIYRDNAQYT